MSWMYRPCTWCHSGTTDASCALCRINHSVIFTVISKNEVTTINRAHPFTALLRNCVGSSVGGYHKISTYYFWCSWGWVGGPYCAHRLSRRCEILHLKMRFMGWVGCFFAISLARCVNNLVFARASLGACVLTTVVNKMITFCYGCYRTIGGLLALPISPTIFVDVDGYQVAMQQQKLAITVWMEQS